MFDYNVLSQDNNGADIQLLDWINGADYEEGEQIDFAEVC